MKRYLQTSFFLLLLTATMNSCRIIGDIFKAGVWAGVLFCVVIVGIIIWIIARLGKSK